MRSMWVYTIIWTVLVLIVVWIMDDSYSIMPANPVTVADTWFKGFVVIAAFHIVHRLHRSERQENELPQVNEERDKVPDSSETRGTTEDGVGLQ